MIFKPLKSEEGYALASVLFLVTILTLVAFSVLLRSYLARERAALEVARIKAEYAAQSGIACTVARVMESGAVPFIPDTLRFEDGGAASVRSQPWGIFWLIESRGMFRRTAMCRLATCAARPPEAFRQAVVLEAENHQLVLAGTSSVRGDLTIGGPGVATGALAGYPTPARIPFLGQVNKKGSTGLPPIDRQSIETLTRYYDRLLAGEPPPAATSARFASGDRLDHIPDSIDVGFFTGGLDFASLNPLGRPRPLVLVSTSGTVSFPPGLHLRGPLTIVSRDSLAVKRGSFLDNVVLYSARGISAQACSLRSVQFVAPTITLNSGVVASYPFAIVSLPPGQGAPVRQHITLKRGCQIEGIVLLDSPFGDDLVTIEASARVAGAVYSSGRVTLDGTVHGTVLARDFFFYEAPSVYLGWLRTGVVDRTLLPDGFLVPPIFAGARRPAILAWL